MKPGEHAEKRFPPKEVMLRPCPRILGFITCWDCGAIGLIEPGTARWQEPVKIAKLTEEEMNLEPLVLWEPGEPTAPEDLAPAQATPVDGEGVAAAPVAPKEVFTISLWPFPPCLLASQAVMG